MSALLDHLPSPVLGLDRHDSIVWANASARELLGPWATPGRQLFKRFSGSPEAPVLEIGSRCFEVQCLRISRGMNSHSQLMLVERCDRQRSLDLREQQLRMLAHDLLSPQSSILALSRLHESDREAFEACGGLRRIGELAQYTRSLSRDFIELTLPPEQARQRFGSLCLTTLLAELVDGVQPCARLQGVHLNRQCESEALHMLGLKGPLMRALQNLVVNAIKASPKGGEVRIELRGLGSQVLLRVVDQAGGLPGTQAGQRCLNFETLPRPASGGQGFGIGLDIVRRVVMLHDGELAADVDSCGTQFELRFPRDGQARACPQA